LEIEQKNCEQYREEAQKARKKNDAAKDREFHVMEVCSMQILLVLDLFDQLQLVPLGGSTGARRDQPRPIPAGLIRLQYWHPKGPA
jgi:hypothetical protein